MHAQVIKQRRRKIKNKEEMNINARRVMTFGGRHPL